MKNVLLLFALLSLFFSCQQSSSTAEQKEAPKKVDPLAPTTDKSGALCGRLHTATIATTSLDSVRLFYVDAMGMTLDGPLEIDAATKTLQRQLWDIPEDIDWETYRLHRPSVPELIQIRLMVLNKETPHIHQSWNSRELGPFSLGFPNMGQEQLDSEIRERGFGSMAAMQEGTIPRPDGSSYRYIETIYKAPDFLHAVGIERKDGMHQLAPVDSATTKGGPGYSAQVLDDSDAFLAFLTDVLDLELRADRHWKSSPGSALGIDEGVPFRFSLVYAKGESHGHLLFLDYEDDQFVPLQVAPKVPNRGLGMWSFPSPDVDAIHQRALAKGITIVHGPASYIDPMLGKVKVLSMLAPNGFLVEIFES